MTHRRPFPYSPFFVSLATWWWRTNFDVMIYCSTGTGPYPVTHNKSKVRVSQLSCSKSGNINCSVCFCFIGKCHRTSHWVFVYFDLAALFVPVDCSPSRRPPRPPDTSLPVCAGQSPPRAPAGFSCSWPGSAGWARHGLARPGRGTVRLLTRPVTAKPSVETQTQTPTLVSWEREREGESGDNITLSPALRCPLAVIATC